jgi:hypothetical protein
VGQTRCKKEIRHICLGQLEKSAMAEHIKDTEHDIKFNNTHRPDVATGYKDCLENKAASK